MIRLTHIDIEPRKLMYDIYFSSHRFIVKKVISYSCQECDFLLQICMYIQECFTHYRPPEGGRLYDMKVVSGYAFLRTYYV